jgi:hypothetical protein
VSRKSSPPAALSPLPGPLRWAGWLLIAEAAATVVVTLLLAYQTVTGEPADRGEAFAVVGVTAFVAAALGGLAVALWRRAPRARAPAIVLQLTGVMAGVVLLTSGQPWVGTPLVLAGIAVVTLLLAPSTATALGSGGSTGAR